MPRVSQLPTATAVNVMLTVEGGVTKKIMVSWVPGFYVPLTTGVENVSSVAAAAFMFQRLGDIVQLAGRITVTPTASGVNTRIGIGLPIVSAMITEDDAAGVASMPLVTNGLTGAVYGDAANDRLELLFRVADNVARRWYVTAMYRIR